MLKSASPKRLWYHCIERKALIHYNNALDIYSVEGKVLETVMTIKNSDISYLCKYECLKWEMYYQPTEGYPDDKMVMGRYLRPATDVGNAMT